MTKQSLLANFREFFRKKIVGLKRKPQMIPMIVLGIAFVLYSFNLTKISDTTARINFSGMGLTQFCTMLFSLLSFVCFMNAFPHRKKVNVPMLVLMFVMIGILAFCDVFYLMQIDRSLKENAANRQLAYIYQAKDMLYAHLVVLGVGTVLTILLPVIRKLLARINTNPELEEGTEMKGIVLSED